jgi:proteasome lid subunit RPN8/RPN11
MANGTADDQYGAWSVEGHAMEIEYAVPAIEEVCAHAVDGLFRFRHGGMEVGGVLFGTAAGDRVRIVTYRPLDCEHAYGPRFVLSERDRNAMKELLYAPRREADLRGLEPVGWYHSHTRSGVELSPRDLEIYDSYFPQRWQIAMVVKPDNFGPARLGFFFRERDGSVQADCSYEELSCTPRRHGLLAEPTAEAASATEAAAPAPAAPPPQPAKPQAQPAAKAAAAPAPAPDPAPAPPPAVPLRAPLEPLEVPSFAREHPGHGRKWAWALLAVALISVAALGAARYYSQTAPPVPLSLWVADVGGQLLIEWDRTAEPIKQAHSATLEILDGDQRIVKTLESDVLREGSIDYQRNAEVVDVRLRVERQGRRTEDMIRFIGQPVERAHTAEEAVVTRERDQLKDEVDSLRLQLQEKDAQIRRLGAGAGRTRPAR